MIWNKGIFPWKVWQRICRTFITSNYLKFSRCRRTQTAKHLLEFFLSSLLALSRWNTAKGCWPTSIVSSPTIWIKMPVSTHQHRGCLVVVSSDWRRELFQPRPQLPVFVMALAGEENGRTAHITWNVPCHHVVLIPCIADSTTLKRRWISWWVMNINLHLEFVSLQIKYER